MSDIFERISAYTEGDIYPFHMPGHKRNIERGALASLYPCDITEIPGFDNLHHPEGILREAQDAAATLYQSEETFFLINGSTCGILSAISATVNPGETLLMGRNSHKAAYHAAFLRQLNLFFAYPQIEEEFGIYGGMPPEEIQKNLEEHEGIKAVFVTSPTMDGIISDIRSIAEICHKFKKPLIVDEAHGAHLGLFAGSIPNSIQLGADLVIHSVHKTLPSLTQTALLHVNGNKVDRNRLKRYLSIYQSSSPSYLLLGSIDQCVKIVDNTRGLIYETFLNLRKEFDRKTKILSKLQIADYRLIGRNHIYAMDICKILISVGRSGLTGVQFAKILRERFRLEMEMAAENYVLAIVTFMDKKEGFDRLAEALCVIDSECSDKTSLNTLHIPNGLNQIRAGKTRYTLSEVERCPTHRVMLKESVGFVSAEFAYLYPPGIPILIPGEEIEADTIDKILSYQRQGLLLEGLDDITGNYISVIL